MESPDKLPLLKQALALLVEGLREQDQVAIVVYAGSSGLVLPPTSGERKAEIRAALASLEAGGSTAGGAGIELAYRVAAEMYRPGAINRVLLATDGDFNVGVTSVGELSRLIEEKRKSGVFLSVLGFGQGNLKDATMEMLADRGNGNYSYIDSEAEAQKVLVSEAGATLVTIAKDVKIQVELNPRRVAGYRLVGYENRLLRARGLRRRPQGRGRDRRRPHGDGALRGRARPACRSTRRARARSSTSSRPRSPRPATSDELLTSSSATRSPRATPAGCSRRPSPRRAETARGSERLRFAAAVAASACCCASRSTAGRPTGRWCSSWPARRKGRRRAKATARSS